MNYLNYVMSTVITAISITLLILVKRGIESYGISAGTVAWYIFLFFLAVGVFSFCMQIFSREA